MSMYGQNRDIELFNIMNEELIHDIISQQVGYYKLDLEPTSEGSNMYGEMENKFYKDPVLVDCLIERGEVSSRVTEVAVDTSRNLVVRFFRNDLVAANVVPEIGDVMLWNEDYYEIDNVNENQLVVGKDPSYSYSDNNTNFGSSLSIIVSAHYTRPERFELTQSRL